jgi:hypothetical protein
MTAIMLAAAPSASILKLQFNLIEEKLFKKLLNEDSKLPTPGKRGVGIEISQS